MILSLENVSYKCETLWYVADMTKRSGYPLS